ncbi:putative integrase catalytic region [Burkholderia oklahomensis]|uniref:Integrase catalytic region n=1 Tax=Burkholderia oklahomensis TaxID=342113 RepID=A0AAI8FR88_9BURK|nr:putative integrase catalytic region [Burkholderia oklahomensis]
MYSPEFFHDAILSLEWKEVLWVKFFTEAPQRQRQSVEQYKVVKSA